MRLIWITGRRRSGLKSYPEGLHAYIDLATGMEEYNFLYPFFQNTIRNGCITEDELDKKLSRYRFYMKRRENITAAPLDILHSLPSTEELPPAPGTLDRIKRFFSAGGPTSQRLLKNS